MTVCGEGSGSRTLSERRWLLLLVGQHLVSQGHLTHVKSNSTRPSSPPKPTPLLHIARTFHTAQNTAVIPATVAPSKSSCSIKACLASGRAGNKEEAEIASYAVRTAMHLQMWPTLSSPMLQNTQLVSAICTPAAAALVDAKGAFK